MVSGRQTLATIDQALTQAQAKVAAVEDQIASVNQRLDAQRQAQTQDYRELARVRLGQLADASMVKHLDQAEQQIMALLAQRQAAVAQLEQQSREAAAARQALEAERAAQADQVDSAAAVLDAAEARTQARLETDPAYQAQREHAREAERMAMHAAEKAQRSADEREQKGASYRADPLFMYLWERHFGLPDYRKRGLIALLDGKVAHLIGYADARANYARLNEIPERLHDHAAGLKAQAEAAFAALQALDEAARAADGIPALAAQLAAEQAALEAVDQHIAQFQTDQQAVVVRKALFAAGEDEYTKQAVSLLAAEVQRDDLMELRREALATPLPDDDRIVARLLQRDDERRRDEASLQGLREALGQHQQRLSEVESLRTDFKRNRYDRPGSTFGDDAMITMLLGQFINGVLDRRNLWRILQEQQRYRPQQADPDFGSGGFGRGTVWGGGTGSLDDIVGRISRGSGGGGGGGGGSWGGGSAGGGNGGGGFRTGGGF